MRRENDATIREARPADREAWGGMRVALWPGSDVEHEAEVGRFLAGASRDPPTVFVAEDVRGRLTGFVEVSIRAYAEGCVTDRVGSLGAGMLPLASAVKGWGARSSGRRSAGHDPRAAASSLRMPKPTTG